MTIAQNNIKFNDAALVLEEVVSNGNIVPHSWYKELTNKRGDPDYSLICVLAEIVSSYRLQKMSDILTNEASYHPKFTSDAWQVSYAHFYNKFGFARHKMRRVMERLEELKIAKREYRKLLLCGYYHSVLFIHLNLNYFKQNVSNNQPSSWLKDKESNSHSQLSSDGKNSFKANNSLSSLKSQNSTSLQICSTNGRDVEQGSKLNNNKEQKKVILPELFGAYTRYLKQIYYQVFKNLSYTKDYLLNNRGNQCLIQY